GVPCVVGTETATKALQGGAVVTVDGTEGAVYRGALSIERSSDIGELAGWADLWTAWRAVSAAGAPFLPLVSSVAGLEDAPEGLPEVVLAPDVDLRCDPVGLWCDVEAMTIGRRAALLDGYLAQVARAVRDRSIGLVHVAVLGTLPVEDLVAAVERLGDHRIRIHDPAIGPRLVLAPNRGDVGGAVPLSVVAGRSEERR